MKKKRIAILLIAMLSMSLLFSCSKGEAPAEEPEEEMTEAVEEGVEEEETAIVEEEETAPAVDNEFEMIDTSVGVTGSPVKDDFNKDTILEDDGFIVYIPGYWGDDDGDGENHQYYAELGGGVTLMQISFTDYKATSEASFESVDKKIVYDAFIEGTGIENPVQKSTQNGGRYFAGELSGITLSGEMDVIYNHEKGRVCMIAIMSSDAAEYDYFPDYSKIVQSIEKK